MAQCLNTSARSLRSLLRTSTPSHILRTASRRSYASTQGNLGSAAPNPNNETARQRIQIVGAQPQRQWKDLSTGEKVVRTTETSFYSSVVIVGAVMCGGVMVLLWTDVFSPESKTSHYNHAVDTIRNDPKCQEILGEGKDIEAFGQQFSRNRWSRNSTPPTSFETDRAGREHLKMNFYVAGPLAEGTVFLHMTKNPGSSEFEYGHLALDVKGHQRIYVINAEDEKGFMNKGMKMFGVSWR